MKDMLGSALAFLRQGRLLAFMSDYAEALVLTLSIEEGDCSVRILRTTYVLAGFSEKRFVSVSDVYTQADYRDFRLGEDDDYCPYLRGDRPFPE